MSAELGRKIQVGLGRETTRGTSVVPAYWVQHLEFDFVQQAEKIYNESGLGVLDKYNASEVVKDIAKGKITGKITDRTIGLILCAAFGAAPSSAQQGATGVYDHTFAQAQTSTPTALSISVKDSNRDERYALATLKSLELSVTVGDWVKFAAEFIAKKPTVVTNTPAYVAENEFKAKNVTIKLAANVAGLVAATAIPVKDFKVTVDKGAEEYMAVGSNDPFDIFAKELEIKGDFTLLYDSNTYRDADFNNTYQALQISIVNSDVTIGSGSANPGLVLTFPRVSLSDWGIDQGLGNMVEQSVGFQGLFSQTVGNSWSGVLTDTVTSF